MTRNEQFAYAVQEGMLRYGTNYSSTRISNLQLAVFEEAEVYLAHATGAEAALTVSSGFMAGQLVVRHLEGTGSFLYAPNTHPALWRTAMDNIQGNYENWVTETIQHIQASQESSFVIVTNSLDPLLAKRYDFSWINNLPSDKNYTFLVDDSHGLGITGEDGWGIFKELTAYHTIQLMVVSSLGKALGVPGGVILGNRSAIDSLQKSPFFGGASPISPAYLYGFLRCSDIYRQARTALQAHIRQFEQAMQPTGMFRNFTNFPVFYTDNPALFTYLQEQQIWISCFPYPSPQDPLITRVVLNSLHTADDVEKLIAAIHSFEKQSF
jgi:7-keto-8-aminopelargonate synthetase-like enzyme